VGYEEWCSEELVFKSITHVARRPKQDSICNSQPMPLNLISRVKFRNGIDSNPWFADSLLSVKAEQPFNKMEPMNAQA
jgi:hypothetical protein